MNIKKLLDKGIKVSKGFRFGRTSKSDKAKDNARNVLVYLLFLMELQKNIPVQNADLSGKYEHNPKNQTVSKNSEGMEQNSTGGKYEKWLENN